MIPKRREPQTAVRLPAGVRATLRRLADAGDTTMTTVVIDSIELFAAVVKGGKTGTMIQHLSAIHHQYKQERYNGNG